MRSAFDGVTVSGRPLSPVLVLGGLHLNLPCDQSLRALQALVLKGNNLYMSGHHFLKVLLECHNLRFLHLDTLSVHRLSRASAWSLAPIYMGSLEYFGFFKGIRYYYRHITELVDLDFLQHISFPPSTTVAITLDDPKDIGYPFPPSSSLAVIASAHTDLCLELYSISDIQSNYQKNYARLRSASDTFRVTWKWAMDKELPAQELHRMMFAAMGLDSLQALTVAVPYSVRDVLLRKASEDEDPDWKRKALESIESAWDPKQSMWLSILAQIPQSVAHLTMLGNSHISPIPASRRGSKVFSFVRYHQKEWLGAIAETCQRRKKKDGQPVEKIHLAVDDDIFADSIQAVKHVLEAHVTDVSHSTPGNLMSRKEPGSFNQRCRDFGLHAPMIEETTAGLQNPMMFSVRAYLFLTTLQD